MRRATKKARPFVTYRTKKFTKQMAKLSSGMVIILGMKFLRVSGLFIKLAQVGGVGWYVLDIFLLGLSKLAEICHSSTNQPRMTLHKCILS